jgi:hypothetical protein
VNSILLIVIGGYKCQQAGEQLSTQQAITCDCPLSACIHSKAIFRPCVFWSVGFGPQSADKPVDFGHCGTARLNQLIYIVHTIYHKRPSSGTLRVPLHSSHTAVKKNSSDVNPYSGMPVKQRRCPSVRSKLPTQLLGYFYSNQAPVDFLLKGHP